MFWDKFYKLCVDKGTRPNPVAKELGYSNSVCTTWSRGVLPKAEALIKISVYFDVSIDYLLEDEIKNENQSQLQAEQGTQEINEEENTENPENDKIEEAEVKAPVFDFEFASEPPPDQPEIIIDKINGKLKIRNLKSTDTVWVQSAAYEGIFPSFNKKAGFIKYTVEELEMLLNQDDITDI